MYRSMEEVRRLCAERAAASQVTLDRYVGVPGQVLASSMLRTLLGFPVQRWQPSRDPTAATSKQRDWGLVVGEGMGLAGGAPLVRRTIGILLPSWVPLAFQQTGLRKYVQA